MRLASLLVSLGLLAACADPAPATSDDERDAFVIDTLAVDNYAWARRDPGLVAMKLAKMQRDPFTWLRGTGAVFWRDVTDPDAARTPTAFGSVASSRVLLTGDPHPENLGTFHASDGAMVVDWNDFDTAGYGPYEGDLRRLAAGMIIAAGSDDGLARAVATGYRDQIAELAAGDAPVAVGSGASPYLDKLIGKAVAAEPRIDVVAPIGADGARAIAFGDLKNVGSDGVIGDRLVAVTPEEDAMISASLGQAPALRARHLGQGVSSFPALRFDVVVNDVLLELKEERDGVVIAGLARDQAAEWDSPGARAVDTQRRLQARRDEDAQLATAGALFRVREDTALQRGTDAGDIAALDPDERRALAQVFGRMLARAHGDARTEDGELGYAVIAPLLAADPSGFADELEAFAEADAAQITDDWQRLQGRDLAALIVPAEAE